MGAGFVACAACAGPGSDVSLAPFYTRAATGDGGVDHELLGGLYRQRSGAETGEVEAVTVGPLFSWDDLGPDRWRSHYLVPLGYTTSRDEEFASTLLPLYFAQRSREKGGELEWKAAALPGLLFRKTREHGVEVGWFPIVGYFEDFLTFDKLLFVGWPLYVYARRGERRSHHFLYPVLGWTLGGGETSYHLWPLFGRAYLEDRYERYYVLWPLWHWNRNGISGEREEEERAWLVLPFGGRTRRGSYQATTVLWPFFGYASDSDSGGWGLDAPWFLVRIQRTEDVHRTRFWPLYSYLRADGLVARSFLWPIVHVREERSFLAERDGFWVVPLWQSWDRLDLASGERAAWRKLFPLFQLERRNGWQRGSFPTLDPFQRNDLIDRHFAWAWKLWEWEQDGPLRRERSFAGLWRRERDAAEDRRSLSFLWASRRYRAGGRAVRETSLLFGLLRWRVTRGEGFDMLGPAFPGPGWPAARTGD